jgi:CBS domain-containing protein
MPSASDNIKNIAVSDFMTRSVKTIKENETMRQACKLMYQDNIGSVVIVKKQTDDEAETLDTKMNNEMPIGIVTERDLARMVGFSAKFFADMTVSEVMSKPLITININKRCNRFDGAKGHQEIANCRQRRTNARYNYF